MGHLSSRARSAQMAKVRPRGTAPELRVRKALRRSAVQFSTNSAQLPGTPDIVVRDAKFVIFVHGCFWHGHSCKRGKRPASNVSFWAKKLSANDRRDRRVRRLLRGMGWNTSVVWECQTVGLRLGQAVSRILRRIERNRRRTPLSIHESKR